MPRSWVASVFTPVGRSSSVAVSSVAEEMNTSANAAAKAGGDQGQRHPPPHRRPAGAERAPDLLQAVGRLRHRRAHADDRQRQEQDRVGDDQLQRALVEGEARS